MPTNDASAMAAMTVVKRMVSSSGRCTSASGTGRLAKWFRDGTVARLRR
jgi:hypothetical protein